jgi:hypothetical protein
MEQSTDARSWPPRRIAAFLREQAARLPLTEPDDDVFSVTVPGTRLTISCPHSRAALEAVAAKYEKGFKCRRPARTPSTRPQFSMATVVAFTEDGEWENAQEYLRLVGVPDRWKDNDFIRRVLTWTPETPETEDAE